MGDLVLVADYGQRATTDGADPCVCCAALQSKVEEEERKVDNDSGVKDCLAKLEQVEERKKVLIKKVSALTPHHACTRHRLRREGGIPGHSSDRATPSAYCNGCKFVFQRTHFACRG